MPRAAVVTACGAALGLAQRRTVDATGAAARPDPARVTAVTDDLPPVGPPTPP